MGTATAQEEPLPPQVIDVWPFPGVELAGSEPLSITFDQPMDRASVEQAVSLEPALGTQFVWSDDRVLQLTPEGDWPRARSFAVTLSTAAQAQNGLGLQDAYHFEIRTIGALEVTAVTPAEGAEGVAADARIVVTFNRPVVALVSTSDLADLPSPLEITPALDGAGEWLNTSIYQFTPSEALQGGTDYTVTVRAGLESVTGAALETDYVWQFRTLVPQILDIAPRPNEQHVLLDRSVSVTFSQPMDRASTEEAFTLLAYGQRVAGAFSWDASSTALTFTPEQPLNIDSVYALNIGPTARSASGTATLDSGQSTTFSTIPYPGIANTYPQNGERGVRPGRGATIDFKSPMNAETFANRVRIEPETEWEPVVWQNTSLNLDFAALPNTTYSITLLAGMEDIYGNAIQTDYTFTYVTGEIATWAYPITTNSNFAITGAHREDTRFSIYVSGTPTVAFELYRVDLALVAEEGRYYTYDNRLPAWATRDRLVRSWSQTFDSQGREGVPKEVLLVSDQGGVLEQGVYWVVMRAPERNMYQFPLAVASANLTVKRAADELLVWVTDMPTARPVVDTTVTVYHKGKPVARGGTDSDGVFRAPVDLPDNDEFVSIVAEGAGVYGVWFSYGASNLPTQQGYLYTDRPIYRPGQTVYFRGALRSREDMEYSIPGQRSVHVSIEAMYTGQLLYEADIPVTDFGTFSGELELAEDAPLGEAYIRAESANVAFTIAEFRVPEYEITLTPQQDEIIQGDPLSVLMQASYYFGGAVSGSEAHWNAYGEPTGFNYTGPGRYTFGDFTQEYASHYVGDGTAVTDANGQVLITSENTRPAFTRPMRITVEGTVVDESQQAISGRTTVLAHPANAYVGLHSDRYFGREGQPLNFDLVAVTAASDPLADKRIDLTVVEVRWSRIPVEGEYGRYRWEQEEIEVETAQVRTGSDGTAVYVFTPPNPGIFRLHASVLDEYERRNSSSLRFWVTGNRPVWWGEPSQTIDLIADQ
ncbi:MAG: Ig-like domain-containing protein, partial [Anaerolineae bacterium]|nr:Ig-like domain-containing protein [Anaerolineae bacterium]